MSVFHDWPEIAPVSSAEEPLRLHVERAVWGKVHGARSDFRWIARSPGFPQDPDLPRQLNLGAESQPVHTQLWRNLHGRCYAVSCSPSRAVDATGRTGFLEKQVLAWEPPPGVPAALGALVLLPRVALLTDEVWWDRYADQPWENQGFSLQLPVPKTIFIHESEIESTLFRGIEALQARLDSGALEAFYARLLGSAQPAGLTGLREPLPPEALAALLLPLGLLADRLSLAGWISGRASREDLALWNAVVVPPELSAMVDLSATNNEKARGWSCRLLGLPRPPEPLEELSQLFVSAEKHEPQAKKNAPRPPVRIESPGHKLGLEAPPPESSPLVQELYEFARSVDRRWLDPETLRKKIQPGARSLPPLLIPSWIEELENQCPDGVDEDQWAVKLDLLRSAAMILHVKSEVWKAVGLPKSRRIPALFFALLLEGQQRDLLGAAGEAPLRQAIEQSFDCIPCRWTSKVWEMLEQWRRQTNRRDPDIQRLIENAKNRRDQSVF